MLVFTLLVSGLKMQNKIQLIKFCQFSLIKGTKVKVEMRILLAPSETLKRLFRFPSGSFLSLVIVKLTEHDREASRS